MNILERVREWVDSTRPHDWYGQCAGLTMSICRHFGKLDGGPYSSAYAAYLASKIVSTDSRKAPAGAIHFWDGYFRGSQGGYGRYGHVAVDLTGGGVFLLSASRNGSQTWGVGAAIITEREQSRLIAKNPQGRYLGWSLTYGRHRVTALTPSPAASGGNAKPVEIPAPTTPEPIEQEESDDMAFRIIAVPNTDKAGKPRDDLYFCGPGGVKHISGPDDLRLLRRFVASGVGKGKEETFRGHELTRITSYLTGLGQYVPIPAGT